MTRTGAFGQIEAHAFASSNEMPAFTINRSSRVIPGFRGRPAADDHHVGSLQRLLQFLRTLIALYVAFTVDVRKINGNSGRVDKIVQRELGNIGIDTHHHGKRLADSSRCSQNSDLRSLTSRKKHDPTEVNDRDKDFEALGNTLANIEQKECAKQIPRSVGAS